MDTGNLEILVRSLYDKTEELKKSIDGGVHTIPDDDSFNGWAHIFNKLGLNKTAQDIANAGTDFKDLKTAITNNLDEILGAISKVADVIRNSVDPIIKGYEDSVEKLAYSLVGTGISTKDVIDAIQTGLVGTGLVSAEDVYKKLTTVIESGIISNSYTRAYLEQVAEDIGSTISSSNKEFDQLMRLFQDDIYDEELAMESSLKTFLNENYENSQYMMDQFSSVATSLKDAIAMSGGNTTSGSALEATIQKWLGALYSNGASDTLVNNLSTALNRLGSGNLDVTNSSINNLLIAAANKTGTINYGELLTDGFTADDVNTLMQGVVTYIASMKDDSNIVMSQLANIFGIAVTDIQAVENLLEDQGQELVARAQITTDIGSNVLDNLKDYVNTYNWWSNLLGNMKYTYATELVDSDTDQLIYSIGGFVSDVGDLAADITKAFNLKSTSTIISAVSTAANWLGLITGGVETIGDLSSGTGWRPSAGKIYNYFAGLNGTSSGVSELAESTEDAESYNSVITKASSKVSSSTSTNEEEEETIKGTSSTITDAGLQDIYNLLYTFPNYEWSTVADINDRANTVKVQEDRMNDVEEYTIITAVYTKNIFDLLAAHFGDVNTDGYGQLTTEDYSNLVTNLKNNTSVAFGG